MNLELDRQHFAVLRHRRQCRITAGDVDQTREDPTMHQAVLLRQPLVERTRDGHRSRFDRFEAGAKRSHQTLAVETLANAFHDWNMNTKRAPRPNHQGERLNTSRRQTNRGMEGPMQLYAFAIGAAANLDLVPQQSSGPMFAPGQVKKTLK